MVTDAFNHAPGQIMMSTGSQIFGRPSLGAWVGYGLGSESQDLPGFVVFSTGKKGPSGGNSNWGNGFLPTVYQGVQFRTSGDPVLYLSNPRGVDPELQRESFEAVNKLNQLRLSDVGDPEIATRINSYEMAYRMQLSAPDVMDIGHEPAHILDMYGVQAGKPSFASTCVLARRLLERGVRFVQLISGGTFGSPRRNWDGHENMKENHGQEALRIDQPVAGLIRDLRRRGLLEDTLVLFTTEFGRTPFTQSAAEVVGLGRDHNQYGFTVWLAGAGLKPGIAHGSTDEIGWKAIDGITTWPDFHATVLHLLGIDHKRLTYYHNGIQRRLTNVHGEVVKPILA
jgi:Protein of unknown function (DUF1501)